MEGSDFEDLDEAKPEIEFVTLKQICETPGEVAGKTVSVVATISEIDDPRTTRNGKVQNLMLCDDGVSTRLTIWNKVVQVNDFALLIYSRVELRNVIWSTTPQNQLPFNHGTSAHELEFTSNSQITLQKARDFKSIRFEKIERLSNDLNYKTVSAA